MPVLIFFQTYETVFSAVGADATLGALVFAGCQIRDAGKSVEAATVYDLHRDGRDPYATLANLLDVLFLRVDGGRTGKTASATATQVPYALVVTLEVLEDIDVDLYTPIANLLQVPIVVQVPGGGA